MGRLFLPSSGSISGLFSQKSPWMEFSLQHNHHRLTQVSLELSQKILEPWYPNRVNRSLKCTWKMYVYIFVETFPGTNSLAYPFWCFCPLKLVVELIQLKKLNYGKQFWIGPGNLKGLGDEKLGRQRIRRKTSDHFGMRHHSRPHTYS